MPPAKGGTQGCTVEKALPRCRSPCHTAPHTEELLDEKEPLVALLLHDHLKVVLMCWEQHTKRRARCQWPESQRLRDQAACVSLAGGISP
jgi:hypothetical protein